jgi:uncharacterized protein YeaO (DUF488 family)
MEQLNLFKEESLLNKELLEGNVFKQILAFHKTHKMANGEFYNTTVDLDLPSLPIKTGSFAKTTHGLSIARKSPVWYYGPVFSMLSPSHELLSAYKAKEVLAKEFCKKFYSETLANLDPQAIYERLAKYGFPKLLCWERTGDFCHRHLVQEWLCLHLLKGGEIRL